MEPADQAEEVPAPEEDSPDLPPGDIDGELVEEVRGRPTLRRAIGGCLLAFACVVGIFLVIGAVATYQGLQERAALNRQEAVAHYQTGLVYVEAGHYELAIAEFEHTLRLDPTHRQARDALRDAKTIALAQPTPTSATLNEATASILDEAQTLMSQGQWPEATQRLYQLRDLDPEFQAVQVSDLLYTAYFNLGMQLIDDGQMNEAIYAFEQALTERPDDPEASLQLDMASLYVSAQVSWEANWADAIGFLEQLYTLAPDYLGVADLLYQAYEDYGDALVEEEAWCLAELQYKEAAMLRAGEAIQEKLDEAVRLCRTPTPTPGPKITPTLSITATGVATGTTSLTQTTPLSTAGSILFSRFDQKAELWQVVAVTPSGGEPVVILTDATQPATSPNGQLIAYHAEAASEGLHVFNVVTGDDVRATTFREDVTPDWSPDNQRFVFPSQRSGDRRWQILIGWADGKGEPVILTEGRTPAWSPDGSLIVFQGADEQGNNPGLYLISAEGGPVTRLTEDEGDRAPAWSPACADGVLSATPVLTTPQATLVPTDEVTATVVVDDEEEASEGAEEAAVSGCRIAFMSSRDGDWEIYTADVTSGKVERLTTSTGNDGLPIWSPGGEFIAFVSDRDGEWGVYVMPAAGGEARKVAVWGEEHSDWLIERIAWVR
jgi:TolB protein